MIFRRFFLDLTLLTQSKIKKLQCEDHIQTPLKYMFVTALNEPKFIIKPEILF